ncbi:phospholipase-like protein, partial [Tanacetum coccineum]
NFIIGNGLQHRYHLYVNRLYSLPSKMDLSDYEVPRVLVTCRNDENENIPLYYHVVDRFQIQFGREEFCLVTGLKFGVENWTDYNDESEPIPFRRRVFSSSLDGQPIRGKHVEALINSEAFKKLDDNDAVSLCCVGILQLVLLGLEDRRPVPNWILRLANDRDGWDNYPWGSHVWPTLYKQLKDANVRRWPALYATQPTDEVDKKSYSLTGFLWAFKTWILESFRAATNDYYTRYRRHPRIVAWSSKNKFYLRMLRPFLHGQLPVERLVPDEIKAGSRWWVLSRAYFDGRNIEDERIPRHINRNNYFEVPSEMYMEDMRGGPVPQANKEPIIADQHCGISELSGFQSYQGGPSSFHTLAKSSSFFNMATPSNWQTPIESNWQSPSNWQTPNPSYLGTPNSQPPMSSHPGTSNWQNLMASYSPNLPPLSRLMVMMRAYLTRIYVIEQGGRSDRSWPEGWLSSDILIRERAKNDNWTLSKSGTICLHPENNSFMILTDPHIIGTLDGSMRPYPSWKNVNWVYMPINVGGVHWVTGAINLADSIFYVYDSMECESRMLMLEQQVRNWTPVINRILQMLGYNFRFSYNDCFGYAVPQQ